MSRKVINEQVPVVRMCFWRVMSTKVINREYFMESAGVRYLHTSSWRIRNRTSERSERVRFLIQKQRVGKYHTKHFTCGIVFIIYVVVQFSYWFEFYFPLFRGMVMYNNQFETKENNCSRFWLDVSFFSRVKSIVHSSDWLELICVSKFTTQLFGEYFSVCI